MSIYPKDSYVEILRDNVWHAAIVEETDDDEILVGYLELKYSEWLPHDRAGIRKMESPPVTTPVRSKLEPVPPAPIEEPIKIDQVMDSPQPSKYKVGDSVLAAWSKSKSQPARIEAVLPNKEYRVQFEDGVKKIVSENHMTREADIIPDPSYPKYSTRHKSIDFNSLQNSEEISHKKKKKKDKQRLKFKFKLNKPSPPENNFKNEFVIEAEVHHAPEVSNFEMESVPRESFDPSQSFLLTRKGGGSQYTLPLSDPRLPPGWFKHKIVTNNRYQAVIVNQDGKKFYGRKSLIKYFTKLNKPYPMDKFHFSYIEPNEIRRKKKISESSVEKKIKTLSPVIQSTPEKTSSIFQDLNSNLDSEGNYTCPKEECRKKFRKENLLMMHLKHYHPEYKNMLPPTPNVADLAYARTNSMDAAEEHPKFPKKKENMGNSENLTVPPIKLSLIPTKQSSPHLIPRVKSDSNISSLDFEIKTPIYTHSEPRVKDVVKIESVGASSLDWESQIARFEISKRTTETKSLHPPISSSVTSMPVTPDKKDLTKPNFISPPSVKFEKMKKEEVVNCVCGVMEEDGLMIMCELCLCWQHAHCFGIETDVDVPERYVCSICKNPPLQRKSLMYLYDQDWLKKGNLPSIDQNRQYDEEFLKTQNILSQSHTLTGKLCKLSNSLHNASIKVQIVQEPNHPKLYLWDQCVKPEEQTDLKITTDGPIIPKPEAPIDSQQCRLNLLSQVEQDYDHMEQKMDELEYQLRVLETDSSSLMGDPINDKPTLQMLLRDLETLRMLASVN